MTDLPAGPELDALVGTRVMGWRFEGNSFWGEGATVLFTPSTSIGDAWRVGEHLMKFSRTADFRVGYDESRGCYFAEFGDSTDLFHWEAEALTAPHAICLAALKAVSPDA